MRVLDGLEVDEVDADQAPLAVDLAIAYLERIRRAVSVVVPNVFGTDGRRLVDARGDLVAMAAAVAPMDRAVAAALTRIAAIDLDISTHAPDLFAVVDATAGEPPLPRSIARLRAASIVTTTEAIGRVDDALRVLAPAFDDLLRAAQRAIAARAEDGDDLLERWARCDWSVVRRSTPGIERHLPNA